jgi:hypothetical protein
MNAMMNVIRLAAICSLLGIACTDAASQAPGTIFDSAATYGEGEYSAKACTKVINERNDLLRRCKEDDKLTENRVRTLTWLRARKKKIQKARHDLNCIGDNDYDNTVLARCRKLNADWKRTDDLIADYDKRISTGQGLESRCKPYEGGGDELQRLQEIIYKCEAKAAQREKEAAPRLPDGTPIIKDNNSDCSISPTTSRPYRLGNTATIVPTKVPAGCGGPCLPLPRWGIPGNATCVSQKRVAPAARTNTAAGAPKAPPGGGAGGPKTPGPSQGSGGCLNVTNARAKGVVGDQCVH